MLIYHLPILKPAQLEVAKEGLCYQQAGGGNFSPAFVINSSHRELSQPLQLQVEANVCLTCSSQRNYRNLPKVHGRGFLADKLTFRFLL